MAAGDITYWRYARHGDLEQAVGPEDLHLPAHHGHYSYLQKMEPPMSVDEILAERGKTHGDFGENAYYSQALKLLFRSSEAWPNMTSVMREALDAKALKLSRILSGNFREPDHWRDDAGYSTLVVKSLD
jgi:hypothetical protein